MEKGSPLWEGAELLVPPDTLLPFLEEDGASKYPFVYDGTPKSLSPKREKNRISES